MELYCCTVMDDVFTYQQQMTHLYFVICLVEVLLDDVISVVHSRVKL